MLSRSKYRLLWFIPFLFACQLSGLVEPTPTTVEPTDQPPSSTPETVEPEASSVNVGIIPNNPLNGRSIPVSEFSYTQLAPFEPMAVTLPAVVPLYTPDFAQIANLGQFELSESEAAQLGQAGYLLRPDRVTTDAASGYPANLPAMLTVDLVMLQTQAIQQQVTQSAWETFTQKQTYDAITGLIVESQEQLAAAEDPLTQQAAQKNLAIFNLAGKFYDPAWPVVSEVNEEVMTEFALFEIEDELQSPLLNKRVRYSTILQDPFSHVRAYIWFLVAAPQIDPAQSAAEQRLAGRQIELLLEIWSAGNVPAWQNRYFDQQFRQGAVSPSVEEWQSLVQAGAAGDDLIVSASRFESAKFELFPAQRPFSQRVFDELVFNRVGVYGTADFAPVTALNTDAGIIRATPRLIGLAAALGSDLALEKLLEEGEDGFAGWEQQMANLRAKSLQLSGFPSSQQRDFLVAIQPLAEPVTDAYPTYMAAESWDDFDQWSAGFVIGSSPFFQTGGARAELGAEQLVFVEPRPELYANLAAQTRQLAESLISLDMLDRANADRLLALEQDLLVLKVIAEKGLAGQRPSAEESETVKRFLAEATGVKMADFAPIFSGPQGQLTAQIEGWAPALFVVLDGGQQVVVHGVRLQTSVIRQNN